MLVVVVEARRPGDVPGDRAPAKAPSGGGRWMTAAVGRWKCGRLMADGMRTFDRRRTVRQPKADRQPTLATLLVGNAMHRASKGVGPVVFRVPATGMRFPWGRPRRPPANAGMAAVAALGFRGWDRVCI